MLLLSWCLVSCLQFLDCDDVFFGSLDVFLLAVEFGVEGLEDLGVVRHLVTPL